MPLESQAPADRMNPDCRIAIFAPSPILTVTIEATDAEDSDAAEVHLHAGGQGFWVARMAASLGAEVLLCVPLGGESGTVLSALLDIDGLTLRSTSASGPNAAYVHDRRTGRREVIVETESPPLQRHELDQLYGSTLTSGLEAGTILLTGPQHEAVLPAAIYERLAADLRANGARVLADLSGAPLQAALAGGLDVLKVSVEELIDEGRAEGKRAEHAIAAARLLSQEGARNIIVTRGADSAFALLEDKLVEVTGPRFQEADPQGAGDSMFAALGIGLARGLDLEDAVRVAVSAAALNVTRRGLGSGDLEQIRRLSERVHVQRLAAPPSLAVEG